MANRYDVFVSFKNLDAQGRPTRDSELARLVYKHLLSKKLSVFFSSETLEQTGTSEFKKAINDALDGSETLVVVGTSKENLESKWVHYEWDSFHSDKLNGRNPNSRMFTYVEGVPIHSLPRTLRQLQMIEHGEDSLERLYNFIANGLRGAEEESEGSLAVRVPLASPLLGTTGKIQPKLEKTDPLDGIGWNSIDKLLIAPLEKNEGPFLSEEDQTKLLFEVAEIDKQRTNLLERMSALQREGDSSSVAKAAALLEQLEPLTQERDAKIKKFRKGLKTGLEDIFK